MWIRLKGWGDFILKLLQRKGQHGLVTERIISEEGTLIDQPQCCFSWIVVK